MPASCASSTALYVRFTLAPGVPRNNMRVMSLQYPSCSAPMSTTISSPFSKRAAVGCACGSAERTPPATMVSNDGFSAPRRRMRYSSSAARSCSFMPGRTRATACSKAFELVSTERRMRAISAGDFTIRSSSIQPFTATSVAFAGSLSSSDW